MSILHRIAWAGSARLVTGHLAGRSLIVLGDRPERSRLYRSPLVSLQEPALQRLGGVAVAWGPAEAALALAAEAPDPVAVIVSSDAPPAALPARVTWARVAPGSTGEVQVASSPESIEVRVYDYGA